MLERLEQQKKLTANQWRIIATANVGDMLDFFDFFLIGYVLAFILKDWLPELPPETHTIPRAKPSSVTIGESDIPPTMSSAASATHSAPPLC